MRIGLFLLIFICLVAPISAFADCSDKGVTVIYINGIFYSSKQAAIDDKDLLERKFSDTDVKFINGFNPSHSGGVSDLVESTVQAYLGGGLDYDLTNILQQVHGELSTRKVLLVGHSQGTFYTNAAYDYLVAHGVSKGDIAVYNIASPANVVAGGGRYITSSSDKLINFIVRSLTLLGFAKKPLPANIDIPLDDTQKADFFGGHSLADVYLKSVPDKIVGDMQKEILGLAKDAAAPAGEAATDCFAAPQMSLANQIQASVVGGGDGLADIYGVAKASAVDAVIAMGNGVKNAVIYAYGLVKVLPGSAFVAGVSDVNSKLQTTNYKQITNPNDQNAAAPTGAAANTADVVNDPIPTTQNPTPNVQDQIDDLLEKIDLLKRQIADAAAAQDPAKQTDNQIKLTDVVTGEIIQDEVAQDNSPDPVVYTSIKTSSGGGVAGAAYPKLLISEVQTAGATDVKQEFVELYNPNDQEVDLSNWYLQRKTKNATSFATYAANTLFDGKKISAKGYFLVARQGSTFVGDIFTDNPLTDDNALALKNPNGEILDKVGWGSALDFETVAAPNPPAGQSVGRSASEADTDNNSVDFAIDAVTPKTQNVIYVAPAVAPTPTPTPAPTPPPPPPVIPAQPEAPKKILINEIQADSVAGVGGSDDDWVELYNPNEVDVALADWSLQRSPESGAISKKNFETGNIIKAHGYFLIVRTTANQDLLDLAGMKSSVLQLSSPSATVFLVRNHEVIENGTDADIVDKVGFGEGAFSPETAAAPFPPDGKSIERIKPGQDTDNNSADFHVSDAPTPGGAFPKTTITDATDYSANPGSNVPGAPNYVLFLKWQSASANIASYQVQYQLNGGAWVDWLVTTTKTQENFQAPYSLFSDVSYSFRARATDSNGNVGSWSPSVTFDLANPVVINEVNYVDAVDQWVELYNRGDKDVDLTGWHLVSGTNNVNTFNVALSGIIVSKGYLVISKDATNSLGKNYLYLRAPNNRYIDQFYVPDAGLDVNSFVINGNHVSMERVSPFSFGSSSRNWLPNQTGNTEGAQNSDYQLYTYYNYSFTTDTTLKKSLSPYLFEGFNVQVFKGVTLTIEPGVVIKFYDRTSSLVVNGTLKAIGSDIDNIVFTSFKDDTPGQWLGLYFSPDSVGSDLQYVDVRYGGAPLGFSPPSWQNAVWVDHSNINLANSTIENSDNRALMLQNSNSTVDNVKFLHNTASENAINESKAVYIQGGAPAIKNSLFDDNRYGIFITAFSDPTTGAASAASPVIDHNNFTNNTYPLVFGAQTSPAFSNNQASGNSYNEIIINDSMSGLVTLQKDLPYLIPRLLMVSPGATLTLQPGVIVEFSDNQSGLQIDGTLHAVGAPDNQIIFRWHNFDSPFITPGKWLGLHFTSTSKNSDLEYVNISYAGAHAGDQTNTDFSAAINVNQSAITLKNSVIENNANNGLWLINSASIIDGVQFLTQNVSTTLLGAKAIYINGGSPQISNSNFENNSYGIYVDLWHGPDGPVAATPDFSQNNTFANNSVGDIFFVPPTL